MSFSIGLIAGFIMNRSNRFPLSGLIAAALMAAPFVSLQAEVTSGAGFSGQVAGGSDGTVVEVCGSIFGGNPACGLAFGEAIANGGAGRFAMKQNDGSSLLDIPIGTSGSYCGSSQFLFCNDTVLGNAGDNLGTSSANIGDIDGDGFDEIAVGAPESGGVGAVYIIDSQHVLSMTAPVPVNNSYNGTVCKLTIPAGAPTGFGVSLARVGTKLAVGAYGKTSTSVTGKTYLYNINSSLCTAAASATLPLSGDTSGSPKIDLGAQYGFAVANVGDVNCDGDDDLAVGAPKDKVGVFPGIGSVAVYSVAATASRLGGIIEGKQLGSNPSALLLFGNSITGIDDTDTSNNTGCAAGKVRREFVVGAPMKNDPNSGGLQYGGESIFGWDVATANWKELYDPVNGNGRTYSVDGSWGWSVAGGMYDHGSTGFVDQRTYAVGGPDYQNQQGAVYFYGGQPDLINFDPNKHYGDVDFFTDASTPNRQMGETLSTVAPDHVTLTKQRDMWVSSLNPAGSPATFKGYSTPWHIPYLLVNPAGRKIVLSRWGACADAVYPVVPQIGAKKPGPLNCTQSPPPLPGQPCTQWAPTGYNHVQITGSSFDYHPAYPGRVKVECWGKNLLTNGGQLVNPSTGLSCAINVARDIDGVPSCLSSGVGGGDASHPHCWTVDVQTVTDQTAGTVKGDIDVVNTGLYNPPMGMYNLWSQDGSVYTFQCRQVTRTSDGSYIPFGAPDDTHYTGVVLLGVATCGASSCP